MNLESRIILCGEATADRLGSQTAVLRLSNASPDPNVHLHIDDIAQSLVTAVAPQFVDLIEIATYVYVAGQSQTRGGDGVEDMGANWRRRMHFEIPVRCLELWRRPEVETALRQTLSFLSEDQYTFVFRQYLHPPPPEGYFNFAPGEGAAQPESVVLFSGALDSLGGAVQEVVIEGRAVLLVTHQSTTKLINRLRTLRGMLDNRARGPRPVHVTVSINKAEGLSREYTQRSRSFLYARLGDGVVKRIEIAHGLPLLAEVAEPLPAA